MIRKTPHHGQILTTKHNIHEVIFSYNYEICSNMLFCIAEGPEHPDYLAALITAAMRLAQIDLFVYKGKHNRWKLSPRSYMQMMFEGSAETREECREILQRRLGYEIGTGIAEYCHNCLWKIIKIVVPMLAVSWEVIYPSEWAYAIDYVIRKKGELPDPIFERSLFPINYDDFDITKGITPRIQEFVCL